MVDETYPHRYFRCAIGMWRIMGGWFRLGSKLAIIASIILTTLITIGDLDIKLIHRLTMAATSCEVVAYFFTEMVDFAKKAVKDRKEDLAEHDTEQREDISRHQNV